jgi:hydrogenase maturation protein HypF
MLLEALVGDCDDSIDLPLVTDEEKLIRVDWSPLLGSMGDCALTVAQRAAIFHNSMADCVVKQTFFFKEKMAFDGVGLTGGVFQNRKLVERVKDKLEKAGMQVYLPNKLPCNDGGLSYGQAVEAAALLDEDES